MLIPACLLLACAGTQVNAGAETQRAIRLSEYRQQLDELRASPFANELSPEFALAELFLERLSVEPTTGNRELLEAFVEGQMQLVRAFYGRREAEEELAKNGFELGTAAERLELLRAIQGGREP
jgi:hypothetical protein